MKMQHYRHIHQQNDHAQTIRTQSDSLVSMLAIVACHYNATQDCDTSQYDLII